MVSADVEVNSSIDRLWPDFEWYDSCKSSMVFKMKSLVEAYRRERKIKVTTVEFCDFTLSSHLA